MWALCYYLLLSSFIKDIYHKHINKLVFFIMLYIELLSIYRNDPYLLIIFTILIFQSVTDYINNDVYTIFNVLLVFIGLSFNSFNLYLSFFVPITLIIINRFTNGMGSGDIEMIICLCFIFDIYELFSILFIASLLNLIYAFFIKKDIYPFIPFLSIGIYVFYAIIQ